MVHPQQLTFIIAVLAAKNESDYETSRQIHEICINLCNLISKGLGLPHKLVIAYSGGDILPNGSWTGALGMLQREEADVAVIPLSVTEERMKFANFSYPVTVDSVTFVTRKSVESPGISAIFHPFSVKVWLAILTTFVTIFTMLILLTGRCRCAHVLMDFLSGAIRQPLSFKNKNYYEKYILFIWIFGFTFVSSCYVSVLLSSLTLPSIIFVKDIPALSSEVKHQRYQVMSRDSSAYAKVLLTSEYELLNIIGRTIYKNSNGLGSVELFLHARDSKTAYVENRHLLGSLSDDFFISEDSFFYVPTALAVKQNFCCKGKLDRIINQITEAGLYEKVIRDSQFVSASYLRSITRSSQKCPRQLSLTNISGAFIVLLSGFLAELFFLVVEILYKFLELRIHK